MDPNTNQPTSNGPLPDQPSEQPGAAPEVPSPSQPPQPLQEEVPDWQQGLDTNAPAMPQPSTAPSQSETTSAPSVTPSVSTAEQQAPISAPGSPQPNSGAPIMGMEMPPVKKKFPMMPIIIGLVIVIILAIGTYFVLNSTKKTANNAATQSEKTASSSATDLSTLNGVTLNPPSNLSNFQANTSTTAGQYAYLTKDSTSTQLCQISFGVYTSAQMPGSDLNDIVSKGLATLSSAGASVTGPSAGSALILKDATSSSITYSLPTLQYQFSLGNKHATTLLSIAIMKNGSRTAVVRDCVNLSGAVNQSMLNEVENEAPDVTVTKS